MKIITENAVYVQMNDMGFLNQTDILIPVSIYFKAFGSKTTIINNDNRYDFIKFEDEGEIEFFKELDWIIDYNEVKDLTEQELMELGISATKKRNSIVKKYNDMTAKQQKKNHQMVEDCEMLDFKINSIRDIILYKQGRLCISMPEEVLSPQPLEEVVSSQPSEDLVLTPEGTMEELLPSKVETPIPESGIKRFFKKFRINPNKQ